jgi:hypothetical protein
MKNESVFRYSGYRMRLLPSLMILSFMIVGFQNCAPTSFAAKSVSESSVADPHGPAATVHGVTVVPQPLSISPPAAIQPVVVSRYLVPPPAQPVQQPAVQPVQQPVTQTVQPPPPVQQPIATQVHTVTCLSTGGRADGPAPYIYYRKCDGEIHIWENMLKQKCCSGSIQMVDAGVNQDSQCSDGRFYGMAYCN